MKGKSRLFTIGLVTAWYSSNFRVLLLNKCLLSNYGVKYPIFLTMCHMTACSLLCYIAIAGEIYGAERRMASLAKAYPKLVRKETLLEPSDLRDCNGSAQSIRLSYQSMAAGMADKILVNSKFPASMFAKTFKHLNARQIQPAIRDRAVNVNHLMNLPIRMSNQHVKFSVDQSF